MKENRPRLLALASVVVTIASAIATDTIEKTDAGLETTTDSDNGNSSEGDDDGLSHYYIPHEGNSTLSATWSIRCCTCSASWSIAIGTRNGH